MSTPVIVVNNQMGASGANHAAGFVPDPGSTAGTTRFLREDATFVAPVDSLNTLTGSVTIQSPDSSIAVTTSGSDLNLEVNPDFKTIYGSGTATFALGTATYVGTGATITATGGGIAGTISITTGTGTLSAGGPIFTVTFPTAFTDSPNAIVVGQNGIACNWSTTASVLSVNATNALAASTTYEFNYICIG